VSQEEIDLSRRIRPGRHGLGQLTLVEHALCPLVGSQLPADRTHCYEFFYFDRNRHRQSGHARVETPLGLSASDEFFLWGLLAITLSQADASFDFYATPHYCLKQLGCLSQQSKGGKNYAQFREAIQRLAAVRYQNDRFYDPIRGEHRAVSFGFLSYSLPIDPTSSRAWRIVWDPLFFEMCQTLGGHVAFDLATYRELDNASRRLFLLLKKLFWRKTVSPSFDLRHLAIHVLGYSPTQPTHKLKAKLKRCAEQLLRREIISLGADVSCVDGLFEKRGKGSYTIRFSRGDYFDRPHRTSRAAAIQDSPHYEPLRTIGLEEAAIGQVLRRFKSPAIQLWADVTLAAIEHKGKGFFRRSPAAFLLNNLQVATQGIRTPPDWYCELNKRENTTVETKRQQRRSNKQEACNSAKQSVTLSPAERPIFEQVRVELFEQFRAAGQDERDARRNAERFAQEHVRRRRSKKDPPHNAFSKLLKK
jgi:5-hydroxyisourate hydrolase-like protein (transthyretin family)